MPMVGVKFTHVPYKGGDPPLQALLAGFCELLSVTDCAPGEGRASNDYKCCRQCSSDTREIGMP